MTREEYNGMTQRQMADHTRAHYANQRRKEIDALEYACYESLLLMWRSSTVFAPYKVDFQQLAADLAGLIRGQQGQL